MTDEFEKNVGSDRRTFIKRLVITSAFAAPVVSSFTMTGVRAVLSQGSITALANSNATPPPGPPNYPEQLICGQVRDPKVPLTLDVDDGPIHIKVVVPADALPGEGRVGAGTIVCIYKGDLEALAAEVPSGETPISAYAVVWHANNNSKPDALSPITMTVTNDVTESGDPIYVFDKDTGDTVPAGTAGATMWEVSFVEDPAYVVTRVGPAPPPEPTPPGPAPVRVEPDFTG